jgi:NADH-ubiquinone oxidoreductase chain 3
MTTTTFFIIFIPILSILLLSINLVLAPHNPYQEKDSVFECGFHSFLGQNRTQFSISFFIFGLLFLLFDLEILLVYPYSVSAYNNDIYGLVIMMIFFILLTLGFVFELGKNALSIESKQNFSYKMEETRAVFIVTSGFNIIKRFYTMAAAAVEVAIQYEYPQLQPALAASSSGVLKPTPTPPVWFVMYELYKGSPKERLVPLL